MAQIFDPVKSESTVGFVSALHRKLEAEYGTKEVTTPNDIAIDKPVLVMCQNYSRIAADIKHATQDIGGIPDHLVVVVIIHAKAKHSLPTQKTLDVVEDEQCTKYGLLVDFGYLNGHLHDCNMNELGEQALHLYLRKHIEKRVTPPGPVADTATKPISETHVRQGGPVNCAIQFYSDPEFNEFIEQQLNIPEEFQVVKSVADLRKETMWIVVCYARSFEKNHFYRGDSQNAKILVLIDTQLPGKYTKKHDANVLEIKLNIQFEENTRDYIQEDVMSFIEDFIKKDVSEIFTESEKRIEVYTDDEVSQDAIHASLGITPQMVVSLMDLTKLDARILWVIVCKNESPLIKILREASPANAKVILVVDDRMEGGIRFEQNGFVLIGRFPLSGDMRDQMKNKITELMENVQKRLLKEPLEKLFLEPKYAKTQNESHQIDSKVPKKEHSCLIL